MQLTHTTLTEIAYKWALKRFPVAYKEMKSITSEIPDVIGFRSGESIVIEVKISRGDFLRDFKKPHRLGNALGKYRFYCCPEGLVKSEEMPENWGLIEVCPKGKCTVVHNPYNPNGGNIWRNGFESDISLENRIMYSALRRSFRKSPSIV